MSEGGDFWSRRRAAVAEENRAEARAIETFGAGHAPVISTKCYTGHTLGAAAALEFTFAALAIEEGWIPPALGVGEQDPDVRLDVPREKRAGRIERVLSNSFAFGGNNVSLLVTAP